METRRSFFKTVAGSTGAVMAATDVLFAATSPPSSDQSSGSPKRARIKGLRHVEIYREENNLLGIHLTQVTPRSCGWAQNGSSPLARIERYGVGSTATACCTSR